MASTADALRIEAKTGSLERAHEILPHLEDALRDATAAIHASIDVTSAGLVG